MTAFTSKKLKSIQNTIRQIEREEAARPKKLPTSDTSAIPLGFQAVYADILNGSVPFTPSIDRMFGRHKPRAWGLFRRYLQQCIDAQRKADIVQNPRIVMAIEHIDRKLKRVGG